MSPVEIVAAHRFELELLVGHRGDLALEVVAKRRFALRGEDGSPRGREVAAEHELGGERHQLVEAAGGVVTDRDVAQRLGGRNERQRFELGTGGADGQAEAERRGEQGVEASIAGAGAVEPVGASGDPGADDDMVEQPHHRQPLPQRVAEGVADQHGLGLDAEAGEEGEEGDGFALAVAETTLPRLVRGRRHVAALAHGEREIADLVLDEAQRRHRPNLRIRVRCRDPLDLGLERRCRSERLRLGVEGRHHPGDSRQLA